MAITTKQFQLLTDINLVWDFLVDIYDRENGSGMPGTDCGLMAIRPLLSSIMKHRLLIFISQFEKVTSILPTN